ncbi:MAG: ChaN family lipoprotein [Desulfocapsa sp.]|nr:ChaN family lipoprotein [Desulfocapsa sp.]
MTATQSKKRASAGMAVSVVTLVLFFQLFAFGCAPTTPLPLDTLKPDETSQLAENLSDFRAVCIGEAHTVARHHTNQLTIIQGLHDRGADVAIGLEMFPFTSQPLLDNWIEGSISLEDFTKGYHQNWQIPFSMYEAIFLYAQKKKIPLLGLNLPKSISGKMARQGFHSLTPQEKENLPGNIYCKPNSAQMLLLRGILASRGDNGTLFRRFCEAHMLRDKTMALYAGKYLEQNPEKTLVVLAGINHCMKQGVPEYLEERSKERTLVILPAASEEVLKQPITSKNADYLLAE